MSKKYTFLFFVSIVSLSSLNAQNASWVGNNVSNVGTLATQNAEQGVSSKTPPPTNGFFESGTFERRMDKVFDTDKDSFDFENGILNWKGKTFNMGNSRMVRARFERYLSMPALSQDFHAYQSILSEITARLAASNDRLPEEVLRECWLRLFDAAEYDIDGKSSLTIANLVYLSWRMKSEYKIAKITENMQEKIMLDAKKSAKMKAAFQEYATDRIVMLSPKDNVKKRTFGDADLSYRIQDLQEEFAKLAVKKTMTEAVATKAVVLYQSQILAFLLERKFQQAQIASMFYRHIYRGKSQEIVVATEQLKELFPVSGFVSSVDMFENIATEARKDIQDGISAVNALADSGDMYGAMERLMETFALGEFDPALTVFPTNKRIAIRKVYRDISALKNLSDAKDWAAMEEILEDFKQTAKDFPSREALSKIRTAKRLSDMHVMAAKQSAALGKADDVKASLAQAIQIWPLNPAISEFNSDLVGIASGITKYVEKFDSLLSRKNYREIVSESPEYAVAFRKDPERAEELRNIVVKISQIDTIIAQAEEFAKQNNKYLAWDILENGRAIDPNDPKLALSFAKLAPEVSDYVKTLNKAVDAEKNKEYAIALNFYLAAQEIFPASKVCRLGIERVAEKYAQ